MTTGILLVLSPIEPGMPHHACLDQLGAKAMGPASAGLVEGDILRVHCASGRAGVEALCGALAGLVEGVLVSWKRRAGVLRDEAVLVLNHMGLSEIDPTNPEDFHHVAKWLHQIHQRTPSEQSP